MSMVFSGLISNTKIKNTKLKTRKKRGRERERNAEIWEEGSRKTLKNEISILKGNDPLIFFIPKAFPFLLCFIRVKGLFISNFYVIYIGFMIKQHTVT